jgi:hypothetical protein
VIVEPRPRRATRNTTSTNASVAELMAISLSPATIASRLGIALVTARSVIKQIDPSYAGKDVDAQAFGLSDDSIWLRMQLGNMLFQLQDENQLTPTQVSSTVGLNRLERIAAMQRPWSHNWTLSQISRLAGALSMPVYDCLHRGIYKPVLDEQNNPVDDIPIAPSKLILSRSF